MCISYCNKDSYGLGVKIAVCVLEISKIKSEKDCQCNTFRSPFLCSAVSSIRTPKTQFRSYYFLININSCVFSKTCLQQVLYPASPFDLNVRIQPGAGFRIINKDSDNK